MLEGTRSDWTLLRRWYPYLSKPRTQKTYQQGLKITSKAAAAISMITKFYRLWQRLAHGDREGERLQPPPCLLVPYLGNDLRHAAQGVAILLKHKAGHDP